ncbi:MAG: LCP family protein [Patescibacteria group bacterium]|nr:LCP family protein [Patescibacteria group bacterium]
MVRIKEEGSAGRRKVKVNRKSQREDSAPVEEEKAMDTSSSRLRVRRRTGNAKRSLFVFGAVVVFLAIGWFAARAAIVGLDLNNVGWLSGLFGGSGTTLVGETDGRVNVLLLGNPGADDSVDGPELTDTIMVASYNTKDSFLNLFSVPRDLYVNIPGSGMSKINTAYQTGEAKDSDGAGLAMDTVGELLGLDIPYYIKVDFAGFRQIVDELGGVTIDVKTDLVDPYYPTANFGYETLDIKAGTYTMDGEMALKYARSRKTTSDFDRARRQQQVLLALREKALELELLTAPTKVTDIQEIVANHFSTNLTEGEVKRVLELVKDFDPTNMLSKVFDDTPAGLLYGTKIDGMYVLKPVDDDYSKISAFVTKALERSVPTEEETTTEPLRIEVLNGTNVTGLAGRVADRLEQAGFVIVKVGNNATRGFTDSVVYDSDGGTSFSAGVKRLADIVEATISDESVTLGDGIDARLVVGSNAE